MKQKINFDFFAVSYTKEETQKIEFANHYLDRLNPYIPKDIFGYIYLDEDIMRLLWLIYDCKQAFRKIYHTVLKKIHTK